MRRERGAASVLMVALLAVAIVVCLAAARVGTAAIASAKADAAADAAALAAADMLALGRGSTAAASAARETASANGARLMRCACQGPFVTVSVRVSVAGLADARSAARAEVRSLTAG